MKIGFYNDFRPCIVTDDGIIDITNEVKHMDEGSPQLLLEGIISSFEELRPKLEALQTSSKVKPLKDIRLRARVPRPGKVLCGNGNYMEYVPIDPSTPPCLIL
ncbi:MAG: hypothetical protein CL787_02715 [Chloroflexi bacterium]|nr:hypothetical protein [Chloroflexota bacterium]